MTRFVLRRSDETAVSPSEVEAVVLSKGGDILNASGRTMLVDLGSTVSADSLRELLPSGWVMSEQGPAIDVPDTRLKVRGED